MRACREGSGIRFEVLLAPFAALGIEGRDQFHFRQAQEHHCPAERSG
jgi:hypothetical protein